MKVEQRIVNTEYRSKSLYQLHFGAHYSMFIVRRSAAFTLIELMVVVSVMALLMGILMPALAGARASSRTVACKSNLRQLLVAGIGYATENDGFCVPAASDLWDNAGLNRWHGRRDTLDEPFDPLRGPLASYLADGRVKECPARVNFVRGLQWSANFEQGCGGYGYNMTYIGSRLWKNGVHSMQTWQDAYALTTRMTEIAAPGQTLMFADTAMAKGRSVPPGGQGTLIEYSFAEPPFTVYNSRPVTEFYMSPSLHFRHATRVNVGWADGHIEPRKLAAFDGQNVYGITSAQMNLGWFLPIDNTPFDLK